MSELGTTEGLEKRRDRDLGFLKDLFGRWIRNRL